jgi:hypothetical protein
MIPRKWLRSPSIPLSMSGLLLVASLAFPSASRANFGDDMRELWNDHVTWTRLYIVSTAADLPGKEAAAKRLLQNQVDIGNAVKPFYGDAAGDKLTALLKDHILIATEVIDAARAGQADEKTDAAKRWHTNADEIASFLSTANSENWPLQDMKSMMREHLELTTAEVEAHLGRDWEADVAAFDKAREQILKMADMLSSGIIRQFPEKFGT